MHVLSLHHVDAAGDDERHGAHGRRGAGPRDQQPERHDPRDDEPGQWRGHEGGHTAGDDADEQRPGIVPPAALALVPGGRCVGQGQGRRVEGLGLSLRGVGPGRPPQPARELAAHPSAGAGREEAEQQAQDQGRRGHGECGPDLALGCPGQLDREARAPQLVQVCRADVPSVGEPVDELGGAEVHRVRAGCGTGTGLGHGLPTLVDALAQHELEGLRGPRDGGAMVVDVRGRGGDRRGRTGLGRRELRRAGRRGEHGGAGSASRRASRGRAGRCSTLCMWRGCSRRAGCGRPPSARRAVRHPA